MSASPDVIAAAIAQVEQGFAAFALKANAKVPITEHGFKNATTKPDWITTQLKAPPAGNYGIVWPTDKAPIVVFDLDDGGGAEERWQDRLLALIGKHGPLPATKATTTPSGGRHAFYRWPADVPIPPGDELFGFTVRWPGRGYLVGPGSSIDGRLYVAGLELTIAELPTAWVLAAVAEHPARNAPSDGTITIAAGGFELPHAIPNGRRYANVRDFVASRYNSGLPADELWQLVRTIVAPRFLTAKPDDELHADFTRAMAKITERLGPPVKAARMSPEDAVQAVRPIEVRNLSDIAVEAVTWLWHRFLPVGSVTLFDGNPGEGKSTIVADVIARLTRGTEWPDGTPIGPAGTVLYITKEDDAATQVRPRIEAAGGDAQLVDFVSADLLFPRDVGRFRELLDELRPRLVILDPLMSYVEGRVKVISDNEVRSALMTPLAEIARETACCILVIRHFNKGSGQTALMRGAGSLGGLAGSARMVLALTGDPEDDDDRARVFGVVKSNSEAKPPSLKVVIESAPVEGFQMTVSRAAWQGASTTSVSDLMERTREEHQLVQDAKDALKELLEPAGSKVQRSEIDSKMKGKGHSKSAIYNAARALHVAIEREGFPSRTTWALPTGAIVGVSHPDSNGRGMTVTTVTTVTTGADESDNDEPAERTVSASRPSHPPVGTTGTTVTTAQSSHPHEINPTGTTVTTGAEPDSSQSSHSSLSSSGAGRGPRPPARAREDEPPADLPALRVVRTSDAHPRVCNYFREHQLGLVQVDGEWVCPICDPNLPPTGVVS